MAWAPSKSTVSPRLVEQQGGVGDHRTQPLGVGQQLLDDGVGVDGAPVVDLGEQVVADVEGGLDLLLEDALVEEVGDADADAVDLVGVRRADPAAGGADLVLAEEALGDLSIVEWYDAMTCALALTTRPPISTPRSRSPSSSRKSASGETTTPLAMTLVAPGVRMPLGSRWVAYFSPLMTMVWPALCPPLVRTT